MASVKISELPAIDTLANDDVIIVNDTSTNTTKKATISQLIGVNNLTTTLVSGNDITLTGNASCVYARVGNVIVGNITVNGTFTNSTESSLPIILKTTAFTAKVYGGSSIDGSRLENWLLPQTPTQTQDGKVLAFNLGYRDTVINSTEFTFTYMYSYAHGDGKKATTQTQTLKLAAGTSVQAICQLMFFGIVTQ